MYLISALKKNRLIKQVIIKVLGFVNFFMNCTFLSGLVIEYWEKSCFMYQKNHDSLEKRHQI